MNKEDFVTYDQAKTLKELGFDWECTHGYYMFNDKEPWLNTCGYAKNTIGGDFFYYSAPTLAQAQKWLREVKGIALNIDAHDGGFYQWEEIYLPNAQEYEGYVHYDVTQYPTYEEALSEGIDRVLELLVSTKNNE